MLDDSHTLEPVRLNDHDLECIVCNACTCHSAKYLEEPCLD